MRNLILVLGDQLNRDSGAFDDFDSEQDAVWMSETPEETEHVWCHKLRIAFFLAAMRHFRDELRERDVTVHYNQMSFRRDGDRGKSFAEVLAKDVQEFRPQRLIIVQPGDYRVLQQIKEASKKLDIELEIREDRTFYCSLEAFQSYAKDRRSLLLENFYRWMRKEHGVLLDNYGDPVGGEWNFDKQNRQKFGRSGPGHIKAPRSFKTDRVTREVIDMVAERFAEHPGSLEHFDLPVTRGEALAALRDFVEHRLADFGPYQDAMWRERPFLYHSRLSAAINVKLLTPQEVVRKAIEAHEDGAAPIASVEGFVRQILGWREFIRGVYWLHMPEYVERNYLEATAAVPPFFWDGETDMECVRQSMRGLIDHAYAHHIQRLMVLGNLALLLGVEPRKFHEWHMAMYADAIDWVSLPNALGMSQHADGGVVGTKPYCASGNYIDKMSNYCKHCRYDPHQSTGDDACPFTTLYWDFLARHRKKFDGNARMKLIVKNLDRKQPSELEAVQARAKQLRDEWSAQP